MELQMTKPSFETLVEANKTLKIEENYLYIEVPNEFARDLLESTCKPLKKSYYSIFPTISNLNS